MWGKGVRREGGRGINWQQEGTGARALNGRALSTNKHSNSSNSRLYGRRAE